MPINKVKKISTKKIPETKTIQTRVETSYEPDFSKKKSNKKNPGKEIKSRIINTSQYELIPKPQVDPDAIWGYEIIPMVMFNALIVARKGSGKTNLVWNLIKDKADVMNFSFL